MITHSQLPYVAQTGDNLIIYRSVASIASQLQSRTIYGIDSGSVNNYVITPTGTTSTTLKDGMELTFIPKGTSTSASVLNYNGTGNATILKPYSGGLIGIGLFDLAANASTTVMWSAASNAWILKNVSSYAFLNGDSYQPFIAQKLTVSGLNDGNGAELYMLGNGGVTPNKILRANSGSFQVINSAYTQALLTLTDAGDLNVLRNFAAVNGVFTGTLASYGSATFGTTANNNGAAFPQYSQGMHVTWNHTSGGGETDFVAYQGGGSVGGFNFYNVSSSGVTTYLGGLTSTGNLTIAANANIAQTLTAAGLQVNGYGTFTQPVTLPQAQSANQAVNLGQLNTALSTLNNNSIIANLQNISPELATYTATVFSGSGAPGTVYLGNAPRGWVALQNCYADAPPTYGASTPIYGLMVTRNSNQYATPNASNAWFHQELYLTDGNKWIRYNINANGWSTWQQITYTGNLQNGGLSVNFKGITAAGLQITASANITGALNAGSVISTGFLAGWGSPNGGAIGYGFTSDGAHDSGMFGLSDGFFGMYSNGVQNMLVQPGSVSFNVPINAGDILAGGYIQGANASSANQAVMLGQLMNSSLNVTFNSLLAAGSSTALAAAAANFSESTQVISAAPSINQTVYISNGGKIYFTAAPTSNWTLNLTHSSSTTLNSVMNIGQEVNASVFVSQGTSQFNIAPIIDGTVAKIFYRSQLTKIYNGVDVYQYSIIKTAAGKFTVMANAYSLNPSSCYVSNPIVNSLLAPNGYIQAQDGSVLFWCATPTAGGESNVTAPIPITLPGAPQSIITSLFTTSGGNVYYGQVASTSPTSVIVNDNSEYGTMPSGTVQVLGFYSPITSATAYSTTALPPSFYGGIDSTAIQSIMIPSAAQGTAYNQTLQCTMASNVAMVSTWNNANVPDLYPVINSSNSNNTTVSFAAINDGTGGTSPGLQALVFSAAPEFNLGPLLCKNVTVNVTTTSTTAVTFTTPFPNKCFMAIPIVKLTVLSAVFQPVIDSATTTGASFHLLAAYNGGTLPITVTVFAIGY